MDIAPAAEFKLSLLLVITTNKTIRVRLINLTYCYSNSISLTSSDPSPSWWKLSFPCPSFVSHIEIYDREDKTWCKLIDGLQVGNLLQTALRQ